MSLSELTGITSMAPELALLTTGLREQLHSHNDNTHIRGECYI